MSKRSRRPARAGRPPKSGAAATGPVNAEKAGPGTTAPAHPQSASPLPGFTGGVLVDVATRLWRARRHATRAVESTDADRAAPLARSVLREVDAALAALDRAGVVVQDHDGAAFDPGLTLVAVSFQPVDGLPHEVVLETLRPSIYLGSRHVQRGEVVVGVPKPPEPDRPEPGPLEPGPLEPDPPQAEPQSAEESPNVH